MEVSGLQVIKYIFHDWHRFHHYKYHWIKSNREKYNHVMDKLKRISTLDWKETRLDEISFTVFDLETTGFYPRIGDEVVSIGAMKMNLQHMEFPEHFYEVIKPIKWPSAEVQHLIGLSDNDIHAGKAFPLGFLNFIEFSRDTVLVAHPASFDVPFLKEVARRWGLPTYQPFYIDSYEIAKFLYPDENNSLDHLVKRFGIVQKSRHHALNDAHMTADIFRLLVDKLNDHGVVTLDDYLKINNRRR